jgi:hypothetical protein
MLSWGCAILVVFAVSWGCTSVRAEQQGAWQEYRDDAYSSKVGAVLKIYGVAPTHLYAMRFKGIQGAIDDVLLFRASDDSDCVSNKSCYYILISKASGEAPVVTRCEFRQGSLTHHFHRDGSNFFVFDFLCSGVAMQVQVSNGHFLVVAGPDR